MKTRLIGLAATLFAASPLASAQVLPIASDSFDYNFPGLLHDQNGGSGWANAWFDGPSVNHNDVVVQANPPTNGGNPWPWPEADNVGFYAQQAIEWGYASRVPSQVGHDDVVENGMFGKDGTTLWISVTMRNIYQVGVHMGAVSFWETGVGEKWMMGSPYASYGWGYDACPGIGCITLVPGSNDTVSARLVLRVDFQPGAERVRMWLDPADPHPNTPPGFDVTTDEDLRFNEIRIWAGGGAALYYWDNLVIEKGVPILPTSYCFGDGTASPCPCGNSGAPGQGCANSTGNGAVATPTGTTSVAADDFGISAVNLLPSQPALLFVGENAVNGGAGVLFGDGLRCAGGNVIRLGVKSPNASGAASWGPGLGAIAGWNFGDVRRFQVWYRDPVGSACGAGFNLSNGVEAFFTL